MLGPRLRNPMILVFIAEGALAWSHGPTTHLGPIDAGLVAKSWNEPHAS